MICFEVWGFDGTALAASLLVGAAGLNAHTIGFNALLISFTLPLSISIGASTRIGNLLGEGNPHRAKSSAQSAGILLVSIMGINTFTIAMLRNYIPRLYTEESEVLEIAPKILLIAGFVAFADGNQVFLGGLMRGAGLPHQGTIMNFIGYYAVGIPCYYL